MQVRGHYFTDVFILGAEPVQNILYPASATESRRGFAMPPAQAHAVDFDTFWARLEYLAGLRAGWPACPSRALRNNVARGRTEFNPLCHALAEDRAP